MSINAMKAVLDFLEQGNFVYPTKIADDLRAAITEAEKCEPCDLNPQTFLRLIDTIRYMVGIAERGRGYKCPDSVLPERFLLEYVIELEATQPAIPAWQPIETAPKDGTYVLVSNGRGVWVARFKDVYTSGWKPECPWQSMMLNHDHIPTKSRKGHPTHWMPLPAAPKGMK